MPDLSSTKVDTNDPEAVRRAISYYLSTDRNLSTMLESVVGSWQFVYDVAIVDSQGRAILHTNRDLVGKTLPARPDFNLLQHAKFREKLRLVYSPATVYDIRRPLQLNDAPFGSIQVGVSTVFLKSEYQPAAATCGNFFRHRDSLRSAHGGGAFATCAGTARGNQPQP